MPSTPMARLLKIGLLAVAGIVFYIACVSPSSSALIGKSAKDFSLQTPDHGNVKLADYKGSVVVIDFWATWCGPCRQSFPNLNRLASDADLARRGLKVLAIDSQESADVVKAFLTQNNYTLPVAIDSDGSIEQRYGIEAFPTTLVIGRDGKVRNVFVGYDSRNGETELWSAVDEALKS